MVESVKSKENICKELIDKLEKKEEEIIKLQ